MIEEKKQMSPVTLREVAEAVEGKLSGDEGAEVPGIGTPSWVHALWAPRARRVSCSVRPTDATPMSACGTRMLQLDSPNSRTERPVTHSGAGVLSTVIAFGVPQRAFSSATACLIPSPASTAPMPTIRSGAMKPREQAPRPSRRARG